MDPQTRGQKLEIELSQIIQEAQYNNKYTIKMTPEQKVEHKNNTECCLCSCKYSNENKKVRHHNHNTGQYHSAICSNCNIQIKDTVKIPVFFHNLNYDKNVFFSSLVYYDKIKIVKILPDNSEKYK